MKPWCAACIILAAGVAAYFTSTLFIEFGFIFWTCLSTLSETIIIFWLYPMGRLVDDITFHFGVPPTRLRIWSLFVLPIFYSRILSLLTPVADWGPRSYNLRELRKKFDSRMYVRSQAPRDLSRNLIDKTEKTSYKLDIIYEERKRRVTFEGFK
nr:uncharacterized protein LOC116779619 isoform X3 [Danaus plexippus plexippus]